MANEPISKEVKETAKSLKKAMKHKGEGIYELSEEAYAEALDGVDLDTVKKVQENNTRITAATCLALGDVGVRDMKKNEDLDRVSVEMPFGTDKISAEFRRSTQEPDGQGGMQDRYGHLTTRFRAGASSTKAELRKVRESLSAKAMKELAGEPVE